MVSQAVSDKLESEMTLIPSFRQASNIRTNIHTSDYSIIIIIVTLNDPYLFV